MVINTFFRYYLAESTNAVLMTFRGSMIPAFIMSTYSPVTIRERNILTRVNEPITLDALAYYLFWNMTNLWLHHIQGQDYPVPTTCQPQQPPQRQHWLQLCELASAEKYTLKNFRHFFSNKFISVFINIRLINEELWLTNIHIERITRDF